MIYLYFAAAAIHIMLWLSVLIAIAAMVIYFIRGTNFREKGDKDGDVQGVIYSVEGDNCIKRSQYIAISLPFIFLASFIYPGKDELRNMFDIPGCMAPGETGVLVSGSGSGEDNTYTFRMSNGVNILCSIEDVRADGLALNEKYSVTKGKRLS